jgi:triosephosphate isomerase (TIM)
MRTPIIAGNWKMHLTGEEAYNLTSGIAKTIADKKGVEVILCPSYTLLHSVVEAAKGTDVLVGGQNLFWEAKGAFTGEISAEMLLDIGCTHVIIGHSERRQYFGETDASVQRRTKVALDAGIIPIVCVGETLEEREEGSTEKVIERQISGALNKFSADQISNIIVAYEPVWAIGTGRTATPETAQEVHKMIRIWLSEKFGNEISQSIRILYGGSMKAENAAELLSKEDIDGGLVGGASLKVDSFSGIIEATL